MEAFRGTTTTSTVTHLCKMIQMYLFKFRLEGRSHPILSACKCSTQLEIRNSSQEGYKNN